MNQHFVSHRLGAVAAATLLAGVALVGCNKADREVARNDTTPMTSPATRTTPDTPMTPPVTSDANRSVDAAKANADSAVANATDAARNAGTAAGSKVADAVITTTVNAELVKDPALSALKIDVDTSAGRVALKGSAPSAAAKDRATQLASAVKGVVSVDNQLRVGQKM